MTEPIPLLQVDAFTDRAFGGNPAAVCWLEKDADAAWMQRVAAEMNLSETAFLTRRPDGFGLRWFTPLTEVDLCGHATLASAHALWQWGKLGKNETARFHTRSGLLQAEPRGERIVLDFPARYAEPCEMPGLAAALGVAPRALSAGAGAAGLNVLAELASEAEVRELAPNFAALARLPLRSVTVTSRGAEYDFVSRFFAPAVGINEDPVTGSAHCQLATYWHQRLRKTRFSAYQASARGGVLQIELVGERVKLAGAAITVLRAELLA